MNTTPITPGYESFRSQYFDLLKKCLTASLYPESSHSPLYARPGSRPSDFVRRALVRAFGKLNCRLYRMDPFNAEARERGMDWPSFGYSMIGLKRLSNLQECIETVLRENVVGDFIEAGAWRGGACIFMRAILRACDSERIVWVADSFEGLPSASAEPDRQLVREKPSYDLAGHPYTTVSLEEVEENFRRFGLLDGQVKFLKGWFKDTLPSAPIEELAILRLDCDMYESTMDVLTNLYGKVSHGGFIIVDDYHPWPTCKMAIDEFRARHEISEPIEEIDGSGVYWRRE
jgi:O-methyltransferase